MLVNSDKILIAFKVVSFSLSLFLVGCAATTIKKAEIVKASPNIFHKNTSLKKSPTKELKNDRHIKTRYQKPKITSNNKVIAKKLIDKLLPGYVKERQAWIDDMYIAFSSLDIALNPENICAVVAVTEQESSFTSEPIVEGLPKIVRNKIQEKLDKLKIPMWSLNTVLSMRSPDGRTYNKRIDLLKTENDLNHFYSDITSEVPLGNQLLQNFNPIKTGGPMQVSLKFAEKQIKTAKYPYHYDGTLREELFSRRGGIYFGVAYLLDYPVSYSEMLYRFADFNAGRYASRNAAFQSAVSLISNNKIAFDGDLLRYDSEEPLINEESQTSKAIMAFSGQLSMSKDKIIEDLKLEKRYAFEVSHLYTKVFVLAKITINKPLPNAVLPNIELVSPKITSGLTTERFAKRVYERYLKCLQRN